MPLVFGPPYQTQPIGRASARWGMQHPLNRDRYYILKYGGSAGIYLQIKEATSGWQTETQIFPNTAWDSNSPILCFNAVGDLMILFYGTYPTDGEVYMWSYFLSADGSYSELTRRSNSTTDNPFALALSSNIGLTCYGPSNFLIMWTEIIVATGEGRLYRQEYNTLTRTWGARTEQTPLGFVWGYAGIHIRQHAADGTLHIGVLARAGGTAAPSPWYWNSRQGVWVPLYVEPTGNFGWDFMDMDYDPRYPERIHFVGQRSHLGSFNESMIWYFQRDITGTWSAIPETLNTAANMSASYPSIECDSNGDLYFVWREYNSVDSKMAVYVKRRIDVTMLWEPTILIANSLNNSTNAFLLADPDSPGIIRVPCSDHEILNWCITWGDDVTPAGGDDTYVYVDCTEVRQRRQEDDDTNPAALYALNRIYADDILSGGGWSKWQGNTTRILNAIRFLVLDPTIDEEELLYASGDAAGAWINELERGNLDLDQPIEMRWTTPKMPGAIHDVPKIWRFVKLRAENVTDPVTFTWRTDGGRATGTFIIRTDGWHVVPLPQAAQGRVLEVMATLTGPSDTAHFHELEFRYWLKRSLWPRRP